MSEIINEPIGNEAKVSFKFEKGVARIALDYDGKGADAGLFIELESDYFIDKLAEAIPGTLDDQILNFLKVALKAS